MEVEGSQFDLLPDELVVLIVTFTLDVVSAGDSLFQATMLLSWVSRRFRSLLSLDQFWGHLYFPAPLFEEDWNKDLDVFKFYVARSKFGSVPQHFGGCWLTSAAKLYNAPPLNSTLPTSHVFSLNTTEENEEKIPLAQYRKVEPLDDSDSQLRFYKDSRKFWTRFWDQYSHFEMQFPKPQRMRLPPPNSFPLQRFFHHRDFLNQMRAARSQRFNRTHLPGHARHIEKPSWAITLSDKFVLIILFVCLWFALTWGLRLDHILGEESWKVDLLCFAPILLVPVWIWGNFLVAGLISNPWVDLNFKDVDYRLFNEFFYLYSTYADLLSPDFVHEKLSHWERLSPYQRRFDDNLPLYYKYHVTRRKISARNYEYSLFLTPTRISSSLCGPREDSLMTGYYAYVAIGVCLTLAICVSFSELWISVESSEFSFWKALPAFCWAAWCFSIVVYLVGCIIPNHDVYVMGGISVTVFMYGVGLVMVGLKKGGEPFASELPWLAVFSPAFVPEILAVLLLLPPILFCIRPVGKPNQPEEAALGLGFMTIWTGWLVVYAMKLEGLLFLDCLPFSVLFIFPELLILLAGGIVIKSRLT